MTKQIESSTEGTSLADHKSSDQALVQHVFANPQDFLTTLKQDYDQIVPGAWAGEDITKDKLISYSQHGKDAKGRLAAGLAAQHFDELADLPNVQDMFGFAAPSNSSISKDNLDTDLDFVKGTVLPEQLYRALGDTGLTLMGAIGTAGGVAATISFLECPPMAAFIALGTIGPIGIATDGGHDLFTAPGLIKNAAAQAKVKVESWIR